MANTDKKTDKDNKDAPIKPNPETLNTPDPQDHMKGPVSSSMQNIKEEAEKNNAETREEADKKKEEGI